MTALLLSNLGLFLLITGVVLSGVGVFFCRTALAESLARLPRVRFSRSRTTADHIDRPAPLCVSSGLSKPEAEDLLDWLEANGFEHRLLSHMPEQGFTVQYR